MGTGGSWVTTDNLWDFPRWLLVGATVWFLALLAPGVYLVIAADDHASGGAHLRGLLIAVGLSCLGATLWGAVLGHKRR